MVVGHSNTVPTIVTELGGPTVAFDDDEFDNVFVLSICRCAWRGIAFTNLQYGAPSPPP